MNLRPIDASLRQLSIFKSVVENSGFSAAQADLNTSAASISGQMKELESQLGMTLCERGRTGFKLTERGQAVYEATKGLFASFDNFNLEVANIREELAGEIRIGLMDSMSTNTSFKMSETFKRFNQRQNTVKFGLEEATPSEQEVRTLEGRYHLAIGVFQHRIPGLTYHKLFDEDLAIYCAQGHPLFDRPDAEISAEELQQSKYASTGLQQSLAKHQKFFSRSPDAIAGSLDAINILILSGHYIAFLANDYANTLVESGQMKALLPEKTADKTEFHMITKRGGRPPYAVEIFIQDLLTCHNLDNET